MYINIRCMICELQYTIALGTKAIINLQADAKWREIRHPKDSR